MNLQPSDPPTDLKNEPNLIIKTDSSPIETKDSYLEDNTFKPGIFLKFTSYFLIGQWLGPLGSLIIFKLIKNGYVLAYNLHIFGGWKGIIRTISWLAKIYCFVVTYTLGLAEWSTKTGQDNPFESRSQFWLVIYTDIALSVLYGAYYSSFTESEIHKFETETDGPSDSIVANIVELIKAGKVKAFDKKVLVSRFPELDVSNFYFVYPKEYKEIVPSELEYHHVNETEGRLKKLYITDGIFIEGQKYAEYLLENAGPENLTFNVIAIQIISRILVFIRVLLPVAQNVDKLIASSADYDVGTLILYIFQQVFYCYFIAKFAEVCDVLFIGLMLYYRKLKLLKLLKETVDVRLYAIQSELLEIEAIVPQNIENWLNLRKIFSGVNQQAFLVIDINTSFTLLYTTFFIGFYALYAVNLLSKLLAAVGDFLIHNSFLQATIFFTILVVVIVVIVHLVIGIMINLLFIRERKVWTMQKEIIKSIRNNYDVRYDLKSGNYEGLTQRDEHLNRIRSIQSLLGPDFKEHFEDYIARLKDSILLVLDGLNYEENIKPHTILGIKTTPRLAISIVTLISAVGITTVNEIITRAGI